VADGRLGQRPERDLAAQHQRGVARVAQQVGDHLQRDDVGLALGCGEQHLAPLPAAHGPLCLALEREHAQRDLGGEVLVGDRDVPARPQAADQPQRRGDDLVVDLRRREPRVDGVAHRLLRADLVPGDHGLRVGLAQLDQQLLRVALATFHGPLPTIPA
jgi:hypothetical protein